MHWPRIVLFMRLAFHTRDEHLTEGLGRALGALLRAGDVVALDGELGAGKTRFVRGVCEGMGLDPAQVCSPTFVLVNEYVRPIHATPGGVAAGVPAILRHVDAYRLSGPGDLESIGWDRVVDGTAVVVVEWAARLGMGMDTPLWRAVPPGTEPSRAQMRIESEGVPEGVDPQGALEAEAEGRGGRRLTLDVPDAWASRAEWDRFAAAWGAKGKIPPKWARCPTTERPVPPDSSTFPFVDARARMADLGKWMTGSYRVSREIKPGEDED